MLSSLLGVAVPVHLYCYTIDLGSVITTYDSSQTTRNSELMGVPLSKEMYVWWIRRRPLAKAKALSEISQCVLMVESMVWITSCQRRRTEYSQDERPMREIQYKEGLTKKRRHPKKN